MEPTYYIFINKGIDKEDVIHIHNGILLTHKKEKIMPFAATWMDLESVILSEVRQTEEGKCHMVSHMCNLKIVQINLFTKQK